MQNKNFILAIVLSVGFMFIWSTLIMPKYMPKPVSNPNETTKLPKDDKAVPSGQIEAAHTTSASTASDVILRDTANEVVFSPQGGGIRHWRLKQKSQEVDLVLNPDLQPLPLATFPETVFTIHQGQSLERPTPTIWMQATLPNGLRLTKTLSLARVGYLHDWEIRLDNPTSKPIELNDFSWGWGPGLGTAPTELKENARQTRAITKGKLKSHALKPGEYSEFGAWSAIDNRYFLVAFLPVSGAAPSFKVAKNPVINPQGKKIDEVQVTVHQSLTVPAHENVTQVYQIYVGPKGYTQLGHYKKGLESAVDFGFFSPLGKVILRVVYWLQEKTGNYGFAIILLTIGLQLLLIPLTIKSFKATMAMKKLQPQIADLQKNYKSDPKRLNLEMMNLYKKSGTNPFGGCLPMVLQLPIFWALFTTLRNAYELRGSPFVGWIHDLSAADPYHVLPVVMGGAMFFQQRMAGATSDPTQRQMMMMMPVMFTVMFFNFPAGLVLYWLTNNLVTMAIQFTMIHHENKKATLLSVVQ